MKTKSDFRQHFRKLRKTIRPEKQNTDHLIENMQAIPIPAHAVIAAYERMGSEIDPAPLVSYFQNQGHKVVMPNIIEDTRTLDFEHLLPDIVIVPLIAFDNTGTRLGQGGGYYDSTLEDLRSKKPVIAVGLAYKQQECFDQPLPFETHDQKLDWVLTPAEARKF